MTKAPERPALTMRPVRFSRTVKREVAGRGYTIALMLEARVLTAYPAQEAVLDLVEVDGRLKLTLHPEPEQFILLDQATDVVEMAMPATDTAWFDPSEVVQAEMDRVEARAIELLTPTILMPGARSSLLAGSRMARAPIRPVEG